MRTVGRSAISRSVASALFDPVHQRTASRISWSLTYQFLKSPPTCASESASALLLRTAYIVQFSTVLYRQVNVRVKPLHMQRSN